MSTTPLIADDASDWLEKEINVILDAYKSTSISNIDRFNMVENTIDLNFAGKAIAKFVAGKAYSSAPQKTQEEYILLFKKHLALNIASIMQGYSNQEYELINSKYDEKTKVSTIDMEIRSDTNKIKVTWRIKKHKDRFFVIDFIVADISLIETKRSEFNSMLKKIDGNLSELNDILRSKNESSYSIIIK